MNALTIDLEYYRMDKGWKDIPQLNELLDLLNKHQVYCTFFVLGEMYERNPEAITSIADQGHEIGFHTYSHRLLTDSKVLAKEIESSSRLISRFEPKAFRAPSIHITHDCLQVLQKSGFLYDSSSYGDFSISRKIDGVVEIPVSALGPGNIRGTTNLPRDFFSALKHGQIPIGSSFFVALLGIRYEKVIHLINAMLKPAIFFVHSWQLDAKLTYPPMVSSFVKGELTEVVHGRNLLHVIERLLSRFEFVPISTVARSSGLV